MGCRSLLIVGAFAHHPPSQIWREGTEKTLFFYHHFFGWLTLVSFLIKFLILLCLPIYFGFVSFGNLRGILRTGDKYAFCWQPIVRFFFIFLSLNKKYFCAHPIFAFYHLPYPSLSILPPQQGQWCRDILDLHTTITGITRPGVNCAGVCSPQAKTV